MVKDLSLPDTINMVSIKRGGQILIPRGHTQLNVGDVITVYGRLKDIDGIKDFLNSLSTADPGILISVLLGGVLHSAE